MSFYDDDENYDDSNDSDLVKDLRKQLNAAKKTNKTLETELAGYRSKARTETLSSKIAERGLDPRIAAIVPSDVEDVDVWLDTYGELFGAPKPDSSGSDDASAEVKSEASEIAGQVEVEGSSSDVSGDLAKLNNASNLDELIAVIKSA